VKGVGVLEEGEGCTRVKGGHGQGESDGSGSCFDSPTMATLITSIIELKWIARGGERDIGGEGTQNKFKSEGMCTENYSSPVNCSSTLRCPVGELVFDVRKIRLLCLLRVLFHLSFTKTFATFTYGKHVQIDTREY